MRHIGFIKEVLLFASIEIIILAVMFGFIGFVVSNAGGAEIQTSPTEVLGDEVPQIVEACERNDCYGDFQLLVMAIRRAEWGPSEPRHLEWGIMDERANTYDKQCGWAAATVMKNYQRWQQTDKSVPFIQFLGNRYCPVGASNDPDGLNVNWIKNVFHYYYLFGGKLIE